MIRTIYISNYALIKELRLELHAGFTTLTGETGAGKSILLGALGLVLGKRADVKVLSDETVKCIVEVDFDISNLGLESYFEANEIDYDKHCIMRREILPSGKSRSFINDTPVKLDALKSLGEHLVDVHSQHDSLLMMNSSFQLEMLDAIAQNQTERAEYRLVFGEYQQLKKEREALKKQLEVQLDTDYIQFLVDELEVAKIVAEEEITIEEELKVLRHAEDIQRGLALAIENLNNEFGILTKLHEAIKSVENINRFLPSVEGLSQRLHSSEIELKDVADELESQLEEIHLDENRLAALEERQNFVLHLLQKHRLNTTAELLEKQNVLSEQLFLATSGAKALDAKEKLILEKFEALTSAASKLSESRKNTAKSLEIEAKGYLGRLQMPDALLHIAIDFTENATASGFDDVQFLFTANKGSKAQLISKVASGGEISRVMLALKAILAKTQCLPAIIFDEIDTGISGETAQRAAQILSEMSKKMQVLAITHLPQIAAHGGQHLKVAKTTTAQSSETSISYFDANERVEEIARLLSGAKISEAARKTAVELLVN